MKYLSLPLFLSNIVLTKYSTTAQTFDKFLYLNPWKTIQSKVPTIIDLDEAGTLKSKRINIHQIVNLTESKNLHLVKSGFYNASNSFNEGRGIGSTLWGWITYPFTWWSYGDDIPDNDSAIVPPPNGPVESIEIGKRNVTVWCNDQTCTTMRCDIFGCTNITCNIYDTDLNGECRIYNTNHIDETVPKPVETPGKPVSVVKPEEQKPESESKPQEQESKPVADIPKPMEPLEPQSKPQPEEGKTEDKENPPQNPQSIDAQANEDKPIELEKMLSATVGEDKNKDPAIKNK
ncbi:unnamed protein product [Leptosia nina]|uniref:Uncharacterized protein n=1 Tax=Leptosia nina TaxID=320188 RepID=A0AAV1JNW7_9NEOP